MTSPGLAVARSGATSLVLTRTFAAPPALVFAALTRPDLLRRWHGAHGWRLTECEVDLRAGGAWRFVSLGPDGAEMAMSGVFHEVVPPVRIVQTEVHRGWTDGAALVTTELAETGGRTAMTVTVEYSSPEVREQALRSPMRRGAGEAYDRLETLLAQEK